MNDLFIKNTPSTPEIKFEKSGNLSIKGKSLPEDPRKFYNPLFKWLEDLETETLDLKVQLEYVNTSSSKRIIELLKIVDNNKKIRKASLYWYYDVDDPDMLEFGEVIQHNLRNTKTQFIGYEEED